MFTSLAGDDNRGFGDIKKLRGNRGFDDYEDPQRSRHGEFCSPVAATSVTFPTQPAQPKRHI
jgi:hypothetical protein